MLLKRHPGWRAEHFEEKLEMLLLHVLPRGDGNADVMKDVFVGINQHGSEP